MVQKKLLKKPDWQAVFKFWPGLFFILDLQLKVRAVSNELTTLLQVSEDEIIDTHISAIYAHLNVTENKDDLKWRLSLEFVHHTRKSHKMNPLKVKLLTSDGEKLVKYWQPTHVPVFDEHNELCHLIHQLDEVSPNKFHQPNVVKGDDFRGTAADQTTENSQLNNIHHKKAGADIRLTDGLALHEKYVLNELFRDVPAIIAIHEGQDFILKYLNVRGREIYENHLKIGDPLKALESKAVYEKVIGIFDSVLSHQKEYRAKEFAIREYYIKNNGTRGPGWKKERFFDIIVLPKRDATGKPDGVILYAHEVTEQVLAKTALQKSAEKDRRLMEAMPIIAYTFNEKGVIEYLNSKWYQYTGLDATGSLRKSVETALHPQDRHDKSDRWKKCLISGDIYDEILRIKDNRGEYRWHHARVVPVKNEGRIVRWIGTSTDIDDQVKANAKKDEFIGVASHELKTPLTNVKAYIQLVQQMVSGNIDDPIATYLEKASRNVNKLQDLISELLDVSRIQSGKLIVKNDPFNFDEMVKDVVEGSQHSISSHRIILHGETGVTMHGDRERIEQIVNNLLSNAVKYSPGRDEVIIKLAKNTDSVKLEVIDFGVGISEADQKYLFQQFYRSDKVSRGFSGLGIGLYISFEMARRHGGKIEVRSNEGQGSTFSLVLPLVRSF